jgi:hypothetical protein
LRRKFQLLDTNYEVQWNKSWLNSVLVSLYITVFQLPEVVIRVFIGSLPTLWLAIKTLAWSLMMIALWPFALAFMLGLIIVRSLVILFIGITGYITKGDQQ